MRDVLTVALKQRGGGEEMFPRVNKHTTITQSYWKRKVCASSSIDLRLIATIKHFSDKLFYSADDCESTET